MTKNRLEDMTVKDLCRMRPTDLMNLVEFESDAEQHMLRLGSRICTAEMARFLRDSEHSTLRGDHGECMEGWSDEQYVRLAEALENEQIEGFWNYLYKPNSEEWRAIIKNIRDEKEDEDESESEKQND